MQALYWNVMGKRGINEEFWYRDPSIGEEVKWKGVKKKEESRLVITFKTGWVTFISSNFFYSYSKSYVNMVCVFINCLPSAWLFSIKSLIHGLNSFNQHCCSIPFNTVARFLMLSHKLILTTVYIESSSVEQFLIDLSWFDCYCSAVSKSHLKSLAQ